MKLWIARFGAAFGAVGTFLGFHAGHGHGPGEWLILLLVVPIVFGRSLFDAACGYARRARDARKSRP